MPSSGRANTSRSGRRLATRGAHRQQAARGGDMPNKPLGAETRHSGRTQSASRSGRRRATRGAH
eukprot:6882812-Heterocapsa_arctica.AAC.1